MNLSPAQFFGKNTRQRGRRLCAALCVFLLTAAPALAEPVRINQVVQTVTSSQGTLDLRLNTLIAQDPAQKSSTPQAGPRKDTSSVELPGQGGAKTDSLLSGVGVTSEGQPLGVEVAEEGEVEGSICDCGELLVAAGSFPKWPFIFLAAVPLAFIHHCDSCDTPDSPPGPNPPTNVTTPTPTPTPTPEPASLLLFGTGLLAAGAGLRRRYAHSKEQSKAQEE
jgi:PEP-CTERM putative exosortase interaction domain